MHKKTTIIFDFDGTIADTVPVIKKVASVIAHESRINTYHETDFERLRSKSPKEILQIFKIPFYKIPFLALRAQALLKSHMAHVQPIPGIIDALHTLHTMGCSLGIVTSNSAENVQAFLRKHHIAHIGFLRSEKNVFGKHHSLLKVIKDNHLRKEDVLYVGDEIRDIVAANKAQIEIVSVSWGFNTIAALAKFHPQYLVHQPQDLVRLLLY